MTHGSLFSGIGGFDLAAQWMGWENKFHCEWNEFGQKVLNYYWPEAECFGDITKTDFKKYANRIDVLSGGFPCQPYSQAGKRKGKSDERHLWPEMLRTIREVQPSWVVGENVLGILNWSNGMVFHEVQTDLEAAGFIMFPYVLPACAVNAPHRRDRVWFIAYSDSNRNRNIGKQNTETNFLQGISREALYTRKFIRAIGGDFTNGNSERLQRCKVNGKSERIRQDGTEQSTRLLPPTWEKFPTQPPLYSRNDGLSKRLVGITVSSHRKESIKAYGNSIVPQIALEIFKTIQEYEELTLDKIN